MVWATVCFLYSDAEGTIGFIILRCVLLVFFFRLNNSSTRYLGSIFKCSIIPERIWIGLVRSGGGGHFLIFVIVFKVIGKKPGKRIAITVPYFRFYFFVDINNSRDLEFSQNIFTHPSPPPPLIRL